MLPRFLLFVALVGVALVVYAIAQVATTPARSVRVLNKPLWIIAILVFPLLGSILWFMLGRDRARRTTRPTTIRAPDDDPVFLATLGESADERIARLEEELRKLDDEGDSPTDRR